MWSCGLICIHPFTLFSYIGTHHGALLFAYAPCYVPEKISVLWIQQFLMLMCVLADWFVAFLFNCLS